MAAPKTLLRRCAVYTRKSSDEGLEQTFNSLDAQREACEAYIRSQAGEGWKPVAARYDDGGFSGGTMDRPGLAQLLADIRDRRIDTVVVYKVDRLTRSLADFAKIVEVFDAHGVSFVSVTQQFNTTTSMGRLTLNMLLSFAQFEREVTGERIRDKIAASKRKGMWMGGYVPLGYEPDGRTLSINPDEAEVVRTVFRLYLEYRNVRRVKEEADLLGLTTKVRESTDGRMQGGRPLSRGYIYKLLGNPLYIGRIAHKDQVYEGQHPAIIDNETWDAVQAVLAGNASERSTSSRVTEASPLMGKLFDEAGTPLTPSHAVKAGRRYRYYVSRQLIDDTVADHHGGKGWRLPAGEIEKIVTSTVVGLMADHSVLAESLRTAGIAAGRIAGMLADASGWDGPTFDLVQRVRLNADRLALDLDLGPVTGNAQCMICYEVPLQIRRRGVEMRLILEGSSAAPQKPDPTLIKTIARAHRWFDDLISGRAKSITEIAIREDVSDRYISHLLPLAFLAPEIVEAALEGRQPATVTAASLIKHHSMPLDWSEQAAKFGLSRI